MSDKGPTIRFGRLPEPCAHLDPSKFQIEAVGVVTGYPRTEEAWRALHRLPPLAPPPDAVERMRDEQRPVAERIRIARALLYAARSKTSG